MLQRSDNFYDNTMLAGYKGCPTYYELRHVKGWRSAGTAMPLVFGLAWHDAQDVIWQYAKVLPKEQLREAALAKFLETWEANDLVADPTMEELERYGMRNPMVAHEMIFNYIEARWKILQDCELVACEQPFAVPIPGDQNVWYIGRLDKIIDHGGQRLVIEHKTTSEYKIEGGFRSTWVESWFSDPQVKGYQFGGNLFFPGMKQVWIDGALVHKKVHDKFRFVPVEHPFPILQEWIKDTQEWISRIQSDTDRGYFPKNENQCIGKYGPCPMLSICRTTNNPGQLEVPPEGYMEDRWQPFELLGLDKLVNKDDNGKEARSDKGSGNG